jgi:hypothetical protein
MWSLGLLLVIPAILIPTDVSAQGRGRGGGPAFCRSGQGHPVFGWRWCEQRGWGDRFPNRASDRRYGGAAFDNGYEDGYEKGLDDGRDRRSYDPIRHRWYREGDRGYENRYGSRARYQDVYRDAFRNGYNSGYRDGDRPGRRR